MINIKLLITLLTTLFLIFNCTDLFGQKKLSKQYEHIEWYSISVLKGGVGLTSKPDTGTSNLYSSGEFLSIAGNIKSLGGFGIGVKGFEYFYSEFDEISSIAPVYTYYTLFLSKPQKKEFSEIRPRITSAIYLFAGCSFWTIKKLSEAKPGVNNYQNFGIAYSFTYDLTDYNSTEKRDRYYYMVRTGTLSVQLGFLNFQKRSNEKNANTFYLTFMWGLGGGFLQRLDQN